PRAVVGAAGARAAAQLAARGPGPAAAARLPGAAAVGRRGPPAPAAHRRGGARPAARRDPARAAGHRLPHRLRRPGRRRARVGGLPRLNAESLVAVGSTVMPPVKKKTLYGGETKKAVENFP